MRWTTERAEPSPGYPFARPGVLRVLRGGSAEGRIVGGRAVEYGCFLFEVHRDRD